MIKEFEKDKIITRAELMAMKGHNEDIELILEKIKNENSSELKAEQGLAVKSQIGTQK